MSTWAIEAVNLVKKFPQRGNGKEANGKKEKKFRWPRPKREPKKYFTAVDGVSLGIERGEIFGLLGPNGAGKSTTIRMLCTLLEPTSGTARVNGYDIVRQANDVRRSLGTVLAGERSIYWKLSGRENLEYFAALYHIPPAVARKRVEELIERMELKERANELVEKYSTGMRQRIAISKALLARPPHPAVGRAHTRPGPAGGSQFKGADPRAAKGRPHHPADDPLHGGSRPALRPHRHH